MAEAFLLKYGRPEHAPEQQEQQRQQQEEEEEQGERHYANRHIPRFLALAESAANDSRLQVLEDGSLLTVEAMYGPLDPLHPILVKDKPESIGMIVPKNCSIRTISDYIGKSFPVSVIDVQYQEELEGWTLGDLVEYFEDEERLLLTTRHDVSLRPRRRCRKSSFAGSPSVLNQISLEFSKTPLARVVRSPSVVRAMDWVDRAWPNNQTKPRVQYYCLTSAEGCYTDYHVDFGGTSVWYHVMRGQKIFSLVPPTHLRTYEDWLCRADQSQLFFPDLLLPSDQKDVMHVRLSEGQTLFIPTGWIHAVYTPKDSLVFGGNYLHGMDMQTQLEVHGMETRTRVPGKFRFPRYLPLMAHVGQHYLACLERAMHVLDHNHDSEWEGRATTLGWKEVTELEHLWNALTQWCRVGSDPVFIQTVKSILGQDQSMEEWLGHIHDCRQRLLDRGCRDGHVYLGKKKETFRITVQPLSSVAATKRKRFKEDLHGYTEQHDDEWEPKAKKKPIKKTRKKKVVATTTARQRLLKRMR